jgi:hypothetical protein
MQNILQVPVEECFQKLLSNVQFSNSIQEMLTYSAASLEKVLCCFINEGNKAQNQHKMVQTIFKRFDINQDDELSFDVIFVECMTSGYMVIYFCF